VFRDLVSIVAGTNWRSEIERGVSDADVVLALIGPNWAGPTETDRARIDNPDDLVRFEIDSALKLKKRLVPVVLQHCAFPPPNLPDSLGALRSVQVFWLDPGSGFDESMRSLVKTLRHAHGSLGRKSLDR
jgi:hypothetical protein